MKRAHHIFKLLVQITFNIAVTLIRQTWFRGSDSDELLTFSSMLQMERGLWRWLLILRNKWENYEHTLHDSSIICIHDMALHVLQSFIYLMQIYILSADSSQPPQPHYCDERDMSDFLPDAVFKRGIIDIVFVLFEVQLLNVHLNELKRRRGRVYITTHYFSVICIFFKQRMTASYSNSGTGSKEPAELCLAWYAQKLKGTKEEYEKPETFLWQIKKR